jgi:hypothetical protein
MKTLRLIATAVIASVFAVPDACAQIAVGGGAANIPTPQGTIGATAPNVGGAGSSNSPAIMVQATPAQAPSGPADLARARMVPETWAQAPLLAGPLAPLTSASGDRARGPWLRP